MKKKFCKILIMILIVITIFEFTCANCVYANSQAGIEETINGIANLVGGVLSIVYWPKRIMITGIAFMANIVTTTVATMDGTYGSSIGFLTPFDVFFNKCKLLDVNFFNFTDITADSATYKIRVEISKWYLIMRLLSIAILLVVLIYVGIRMALASIAEDKAKYKKMLFDWACSLALLFVLHYIAIFTIHANGAIVRALEKVLKALESSVTTITGTSTVTLESVLGGIGKEAVLGVGLNSIVSVAVYALLVFQIFGFVIAYINRMLKVAFLLIISPLITITYSIDKMGDGKSQALNAWLKEFIYTILIQPFHCVIYMTFVSVAFRLLTNTAGGGILDGEYNLLANGVLAILCIKFIKDAEEMIRKIFGFKDNNKGTSLAAGLVASTAMISKAKDIGKGARGMANKFKNNNMVKAVSTDAKNIWNKMDLKNKFKNTKFAENLTKGASSLKELR